MRHRLSSCGLALAMHLAVCGGCQAKSGVWDFEFACAALKSRTHSLSARIARGSCDAPGTVIYQGALALAQRGPAPPDLEPGPYAFSGQALATDGSIVGAGCSDVALPERRDVRVAIMDAIGVCPAAHAATDDDAGAPGTGDSDAGLAGIAACVRFVDASASAERADGLSFATASPDLQAAIDAAAALKVEGCEVWVRAGTYYGYRQSPTDTLALRTGIALYGGFSGTESTRAERNATANPTILSGLGRAGGSEHVIHVVTGADRAVLDGFVVSDGDANSASAPAMTGRIRGLGGTTGEDASGFGGGMINIGVSPEVAHCTFRHNTAARCGGAIAASDSSAVVQDSVFEANDSAGSGGAVCALNAAVVILRAEFAMNSAGTSTGTGGGALYAQTGELAVSDSLFDQNVSQSDGGAVMLENQVAAAFNNCTLSANHADSGSAGAIYNRQSMLQLTNGIVWSNSPAQLRDQGRGATSTVKYSVVMGGATGTRNLDLDPGFVAPAAADFRLTAGSPCIDAGLGTSASNRDLAGNPRVDVVGVTNTGAGSPAYVDIGALEYQP